MHTLSELNTKPWYRALKVAQLIFTLFCISVGVLTIIITFDDLRTDRKNYLDATAKIVPNNYSLSNSTDPKVQEIQKLKNEGHSNSEISERLFPGRPRGFITKDQYIALFGVEAWNNGETLPSKPASIYWILALIPGSLAIAWVVSEIPKRIFYYILLGKIRPSK